MTTAQATVIGQNEGLGAPLTTLSDGAIVLDNGFVVGNDGTVYPQEQYTIGQESEVSGTSWLAPIGSALATGVETFGTTITRLLTGQQGINPATGLPYAYGYGATSPFGAMSGGTLLLIGGAILVLVLMKGGGGGSRERYRSAPRERRHDDEHHERPARNPLPQLPGYRANARRRHRRNARVKFYGAFASRAKAESKAQAVGGTLTPFRVHGTMRYGVMKRAG